MDVYHVPVLLQESVELLDIKPDGLYADLTFGGGGHSREILSRLGPGGRLAGFDQDADAVGNAPDDRRFMFIRSNFRFMRGALRAAGFGAAEGKKGGSGPAGEGFLDGVLADLGVSSHHFDTAERGFSFRFDAPLDMRMNQGATLTAEKVINTYTNAELQRILGEYGEVETPYKTANCIERARPLHTIGELIEAVIPCTPKADANKYLSKLFQALRIEVNGEMEALQMALEQSLKALKPGGRLVVISYHSLEDRMVKNFMRSGNFGGAVEKDFFGRVQTPFEVVTRKAIAPSPDEQARNPRSRSARLRAAIKQSNPQACPRKSS
jgi:16S rRNA (cytosine1402-N4)-methyltransferase